LQGVGCVLKQRVLSVQHEKFSNRFVAEVAAVKPLNHWAFNKHDVRR
jgi:hypothetical protein